MFSKFRIAVGLSLLLSLVVALPAFAGGWAVITLDELPSNVLAGDPLTVGFTVRQHGVTPMNGLYPTVTAALAGEEPVVVQAEADSNPGHYTATLTFPKEGDWEWSIQAFTMDQPMPTLHVGSPAANQTVEQAKPVALPISLAWITAGLAVAVALVAFLVGYRRKSRLALGLTALAVVVGLASFRMGTAVPSVEAQSQENSESAVDSPASQIETGRQLFLAKGCITCHYNERAASRSDYWTIEMGAPNLTNYSSHPEILSIRLKDPSEAKSDTKMPNLELKQAEIEALIAFINAE